VMCPLGLTIPSAGPHYPFRWASLAPPLGLTIPSADPILMGSNSGVCCQCSCIGPHPPDPSKHVLEGPNPRMFPFSPSVKAGSLRSDGLEQRGLLPVFVHTTPFARASDPIRPIA